MQRTVERLKISAQVWDSDKEPEGYWSWSRGFLALICSMDGGRELVRFRNEKLGVHTSSSINTMPGYIGEDTDFEGIGVVDYSGG